jgi:hypothetical protein
MAAHVKKGEAAGASAAHVESRFQDEGLSTPKWGNAPGDTYE